MKKTRKSNSTKIFYLNKYINSFPNTLNNKDKIVTTS